MTDEEVKNYQNMMQAGMGNIHPMSSDTPMIESMFAIGDSVMLKGGGIAMTVSSYTTPLENVECQWFKDGYVATAVFHQRALKPVRWWRKLLL